MNTSATTPLAPEQAPAAAPAQTAATGTGTRLTYLVLLALAIAAPLLGLYPVFGMKLLCFALFACAFNLLLGFTGLLSFGHAAFFGFAAYAAGWLVKAQGWTPELGLLAGTLVGAGLGLVFGLVAIRRQGIYFAMITLALSQMVFFVCLQAPFTGGEDGLQGDEEHHLRQRQGDHGEVDALAADGDQAEHQPEQRPRDQAGQQAELRRPALDLDDIAGDVRGEAEERRMAEGQQAREAEQQVEGAGEQREAQQLHHEHRVQAEQRCGEHQRE